MRTILYAIFLLYVLFARSASALNDPWSVNVNDHAAVQRTYKQGESWTMQVSVRDGLKPLDLTGAYAKFYWFTNTVQNIWWTNSAAIPAPKAGLVTAQWTPAMDIGAASYAYWIGLWMPGATSPLWRVTGTIRMLTSPGFRPNEQPVPVRTLDFASITVTNAPWVSAADWASGSNALASALQTHVIRTDNPHHVTAAQTGALTNETDTAAKALIATHTNRTDNPHRVTAAQIGALTEETDAKALAALATNIVTRVYSPDADQWIDGTGGVWRVSQSTALAFRITDGYDMGPYQVGDEFNFVSDVTVTNDVYVTRTISYGLLQHQRSGYINGTWNGDGSWGLYIDGAMNDFWGDFAYPAIGTLYPGNVDHYVTLESFEKSSTVTNHVDGIAYKSDIASMPTNYIAGFALPIPGTNVVYTLSVDSNRTLSVWEVLP